MGRRSKSKRRAAAGASQQLAALRKLKQQAAAALVGWTPRGLRDANAPRNDDGTYDAVALVAWRIQREKGPDSVSPAERELEGLRHQKVRAAKRTNDVAEGRLVERASVEREAAAIGTVLRMEAEAIERALGADAGGAVRKMIERAVASIAERIVKRPKEVAHEAGVDQVRPVQDGSQPGHGVQLRLADGHGDAGPR